jgi:hypothetical protein
MAVPGLDPGIDPAIHVFAALEGRKTWMPGTRPGMKEYF